MRSKHVDVGRSFGTSRRIVPVIPTPFHSHSVLFLLIGDSLCCVGAVHVAPSLGGYLPGTQPTSEDISCLVSELVRFPADS